MAGCCMSCKKRVLNVAVFIGSNLQSGGGYQYEYMVLDILERYHNDDTLNFKYYGLNSSIIQDYKKLNLSIQIIKENVFQKIHRYLLSNRYLYPFFTSIGLSSNYIERGLLKNKIDLVYFLSPTIISQGLGNMPYVFTLWDLGHLDILEFPEISYNNKFEMREALYTQSLKKAVKVIVDSQYGKRYAIKKYNLDDKRIKVLKYLPNIRTIKDSQNINIKKKYNIKNDYIFYPAQFWPHKNHVYILKAIKILKEDNKEIDVIFSGSNKGNLDYILEVAIDYGVDHLVHCIGFASNEEMPDLYRQSLSLVMPTYLGPTNIPPLEAFAYETPVCYSNMHCFREQVDGAVFFLDLNNPNSLVKCLHRIMFDKVEVEKRKLAGKEILNNWNEYDFYHKLVQIFKEYYVVRQTWK